MRVRRPDKKDAEDIAAEAGREMGFTLTLAVTGESAFTVVRNIYECFRMLGDALLTSRGIDAVDHVDQIDALLALEVDTRRPVSAIDNLRRLRHNVNYYGYRPSVAEAEDAVDIAKACFKPLLEAVEKEMK